MATNRTSNKEITGLEQNVCVQGDDGLTETDRVGKILAGDIREAAKLIRDIDDDMPSSKEVLKALYPHTGNAYIIGISGFPGVGKSTLVDQMVSAYRDKGKTVGVLAVDPTSPFTGGAILGDRVRMQRHGTDSGVFIRSMATRGHFGGLTRSTRGAIDVLDAMGKDVIIIETVGVGQDEIDIVNTAHTTIIVLIPGMGDDIQAIKAGILEVADIFVVNKADREGAERTVQDLNTMLELEKHTVSKRYWRPPIVLTTAVMGKGTEELLSRIDEHRKFLFADPRSDLTNRYREKAYRGLIDTIKDGLFREIINDLKASSSLDKMIDDLVQKKVDPFTLSEQIIARKLKRS
nr:methylmalonyl Co-A mutase-associated GTPase MeaB [Desulfobacterales bacterium]